jgi:hypothetical protein
VTVIDGDIAVLARSFRRSLLPAEYAAATVRIYTISVAQFADFLAACRCAVYVQLEAAWLLDR